jgi:hypothetical protein
MQSFLERYLAGEHTTVWTELIELGAGVRFEPVLSDALAVARETMLRAYHNAELLLSRLRDMGYPFAEPDAALIPARPDAQKRIAEIESIAGPMALSVKAWYETFDTINFTNHEHFFNPKGEFDMLRDTLYVESLESGWSEYVESLKDGSTDRYKEWLASHLRERPTVSLHVAGSDTNCAARSFELPHLGADQWIDEVERPGEGTFFVQFLRELFGWGGFPMFGMLFDEEEDQAACSWTRRETWEIWKDWYNFLHEGLLSF